MHTTCLPASQDSSQHLKVLKTICSSVQPCTPEDWHNGVRNMLSYELFYITETRSPGSDCYREVCKVTVMVTALRSPSE